MISGEILCSLGSPFFKSLSAAYLTGKKSDVFSVEVFFLINLFPLVSVNEAIYLFSGWEGVGGG